MSAFGVVPEGKRRGSQAWEEGSEAGGYGGWDAGEASVEGEAGYCNAAAPYAQEDHGHGEGVRQGEEVGGACNLHFFTAALLTCDRHCDFFGSTGLHGTANFQTGP